MVCSLHDINQLLERYYDGTITPDEEFVLYLALLQGQPGPPYHADRMPLETTPQCAAIETRGATPTPTPRWRVWVRGYAVAVAVLLIGGVGASVFQWGHNSRQAELSLRNGQPIPQEQVNEYAPAALTKPDDCTQLCSEQDDGIGELLGRLQGSYQNSMEKVPSVTEDG